MDRPRRGLRARAGVVIRGARLPRLQLHERRSAARRSDSRHRGNCTDVSGADSPARNPLSRDAGSQRRRQPVGSEQRRQRPVRDAAARRLRIDRTRAVSRADRTSPMSGRGNPAVECRSGPPETQSRTRNRPEQARPDTSAFVNAEASHVAQARDCLWANAKVPSELPRARSA